MSRNSDRIGGNLQTADSPPVEAPVFNFVVPTEFVELPSRGLLYPPDHPLFEQETIEIRHMTAREEDMLTSKTLLKKGVALERVIESLIVDKRIKAKSLLVGDRNAIIIATRLYGYGPEYKTEVSCPSCQEKTKYQFDIRSCRTHYGDIDGEEVVDNKDGSFTTTLPQFKLKVGFRLLNGYDEDAMNNTRKTGDLQYETSISNVLSRMVVMVEDQTDPKVIRKLLENITSRDSRHLRNCYKKVAPNVDLTQNFECSSCGFSGDLEVPLTPEFFWPNE